MKLVPISKNEAVLPKEGFVPWDGIKSVVSKASPDSSSLHSPRPLSRGQVSKLPRPPKKWGVGRVDSKHKWQKPEDA